VQIIELKSHNHIGKKFNRIIMQKDSLLMILTTCLISKIINNNQILLVIEQKDNKIYLRKLIYHILKIKLIMVLKIMFKELLQMMI